jgi:hypothetical protein
MLVLLRVFFFVFVVALVAADFDLVADSALPHVHEIGIESFEADEGRGFLMVVGAMFLLHSLYAFLISLTRSASQA